MGFIVKLIGTIACASARHNRNHRRLLSARRRRHRWAMAFGLLASSLTIGCASQQPTRPKIPLWELATAEPVAPTLLARTRIGLTQTLPSHLVLRLCPEYTLITATTKKDWQTLTEQLSLPKTTSEIDFNHGMVVGIIARLGEPVDHRWPIHIRHIRCRQGVGAMEIHFTPGLYHPLQSPPFVELAHVTNCRHICSIEINDRRFIIHTPPTDTTVPEVVEPPALP